MAMSRAIRSTAALHSPKTTLLEQRRDLFVVGVVNLDGNPYAATAADLVGGAVNSSVLASITRAGYYPPASGA